MGCFSFICQKANRGVESTSFDGDPVYLFLLKDGKVIEEMYGNYDSYGAVFDECRNSYDWSIGWDKVCDLMFNKDTSNGIAAILASEFTGEIPTRRSKNDPNQGWGSEDLELMGDTSSNKYPRVEEPYHKIYEF